MQGYEQLEICCIPLFTAISLEEEWLEATAAGAKQTKQNRKT